MSHAVAVTVSGAFVVRPSSDEERKPDVWYDRTEAEQEAARRNRARTAEIATAALDLAFGYDPDDSTLK